MAAAQNILELAKQGDADAIASLINRSLQPKGITATAETIDAELEITLLSAQLPSRTALMSIIKKGMLSLKVPAIALVRVYARQIDNASLFWESEFTLETAVSKPAQPEAPPVNKPEPPAPASSDQPSDQTSEAETRSPNLATRQEGLVLLDTMAEMKRSSKAYQDVVIRFMDQRYDTVRCMTTLKEFIQVISRSHFSFADMAGNPNLRNLVDTIADNSMVDRDGSHIISNVSILQPGQNWQNARIRLINRVIFEPVLEVEEPSETYNSYDEDEYEREYEREYNRKYEQDYDDYDQDEVITLDVLDSEQASESVSSAAKSPYSPTQASQVTPQSAAPDRFPGANLNRVGRSLIDLDLDTANTLDVAATVAPANQSASQTEPDSQPNAAIETDANDSEGYHKDYPTADSLFDQFSDENPDQSAQNETDTNSLDELEAMLGDLPPIENDSGSSRRSSVYPNDIDNIDRGADTVQDKLAGNNDETEIPEKSDNLTLDEFANDIWETV
jgi:hypothetical protein